MKYLSGSQLEALLPFPQLIGCLQDAFQANYRAPMRHHHDYDIPGQSQAGTLLLMPAWDEGAFFGVKLVAVSPHNSQRGLPTIQGTYTLFETASGTPLLQVDARMLTKLRTAAASALASSYLSRPDSQALLMVGTGALAPFLIRAHASVRPIRKVFIWGRSAKKAEALAEQMKASSLPAEPAYQLERAILQADIISCATLSEQPLIRGQWLQPGQHLGLVGSFKPNMREADDEAIKRSRVYVDTLEGAPEESGDIAIPLANGALKPTEIMGDLFSLCRQQCEGRRNSREITIFKSVGHALEDLAAAKLAWEKIHSAA